MKADCDAFLAGCPSRQLLDRISGTWVALILAALPVESARVRTPAARGRATGRSPNG
ncbi:hypothetical protein [Planobispora rosea]|uniref:hypothetical protein n=1 Tax=Planobispora rosea TaxID=35762 RepID=UPI001C3FF8D2|nr:hypothetical protein [Planobispora rosea]